MVTHTHTHTYINRVLIIKDIQSLFCRILLMDIFVNCSLSGKDNSECHSTLYTYGKCEVNI